MNPRSSDPSSSQPSCAVHLVRGIHRRNDPGVLVDIDSPETRRRRRSTLTDAVLFTGHIADPTDSGGSATLPPS
jgi:hypothetical protein